MNRFLTPVCWGVRDRPSPRRTKRMKCMKPPHGLYLRVHVQQTNDERALPRHLQGPQLPEEPLRYPRPPTTAPARRRRNPGGHGLESDVPGAPQFLLCVIIPPGAAIITPPCAPAGGSAARLRVPGQKYLWW